MFGRLEKQIEFIREIEKLKTIERRNLTLDDNRPENSAEHSWHVAMMALILSEHSDMKVDLLKVVKMLLIHDLVEIDNGDTWLYDEKGNESKFEEESNCADRIFSLLPEDQARELKSIWNEFERQETNEAKFAASIDSMHPLINHQMTGGRLILEEQISTKTVVSKKKHIKNGSESLWDFSKKIIQECKDQGIFSD